MKINKFNNLMILIKMTKIKIFVNKKIKSYDKNFLNNS